MFSGLRFNNPGGFLLSHTVARAVPSAPRGLTSVFGMGTGVTLSTQPPEKRFDFGLRIRIAKLKSRNQILRKISFGSGDLAVWACKRLIARTAKQGQSPRYGTCLIIFEISNLRSEISKLNSDQGKSVQCLKASRLLNPGN